MIQKNVWYPNHLSFVKHYPIPTKPITYQMVIGFLFTKKVLFSFIYVTGSSEITQASRAPSNQETPPSRRSPAEKLKEVLQTSIAEKNYQKNHLFF